MATNPDFDLQGVNHVALVCRDMAKTVEFYRDTLGMPLVKTLELPGGAQHFFFDCGNGDCVAFFWFPGAPERAPGIASPSDLPGEGDLRTAHGSMNHLAFSVPPEKFDEYVERLQEKGVEIGHVLNHDNSPSTVAAELHDGVYVRSVYFWDPDGVMLEFACWTQPFSEDDAQHPPANADGERVATS